MGLVTDNITVTELARLMGKSRPTVYKWITAYDTGKTDELPSAVAELFDMITGGGRKKDIYKFCDDMFGDGADELHEIIELLRANRDKLDVNKIKQFITEEIKNGRQ